MGTVTLEFTKTQNIKPLYPSTFDSPMLIVPPKHNESFIYFMVDTPSAIAFKMLTTFKKNSKRVQNLVKKDGQKFIRKYKESDVGIYVYALPHTGGVSWQYENTSKHYILDETITFNIDNAWIEGSRG